jgi:hypothetical protein
MLMLDKSREIIKINIVNLDQALPNIENLSTIKVVYVIKYIDSNIQAAKVLLQSLQKPICCSLL